MLAKDMKLSKQVTYSFIYFTPRYIFIFSSLTTETVSPPLLFPGKQSEWCSTAAQREKWKGFPLIKHMVPHYHYGHYHVWHTWWCIFIYDHLFKMNSSMKQMTLRPFKETFIPSLLYSYLFNSVQFL